MPELPEVEAARRAIEEHCVGRRVVRCRAADDGKVIEGVAPRELEAALTGRTVAAAHRKGKNLWLRLDSPPFPSFQFGMTGAIYIKGVAVTKYKRSAVSNSEEWPSKYSKLFVEFDDGLELSFTDKRRFARVRLLEDPASVPPISELGPDALLEPMQVDEFVDALRKKKIAIKALLLDQSFISGIGNWVADEVLYQARIHPLQIAATLSQESCESLHRCIKEVIEKALEVGADSSQFPKNWIFHSREKKPGKTFVDGKKIEFITAGGRTTAYVPELQKLTGGQSGKVPSRKPRKPKSNQNGHDEEESDENGHGEEDLDGEEEDYTGKSRSKKSKKATEGTKKRPNKSSGGGNVGDHEDLDSEEEDYTGKSRSKKGKGATEGTKKQPNKSSGGGDVGDQSKKPAKDKMKKQATVKADTSSNKRQKSNPANASQKKKASK